MIKEIVLVVGNGMVGLKFCEKLRELDTDNRYQIITFSEEGFPAYDRVHLSEYFNGKTVDDLILSPVEWYINNNIEIYINESVIKINKEFKTALTSTDRVFEYDHLIMATGAAAYVPPFPGKDKKGVYVYRNIADLENIEEFAKKAESAAVIGGGLLGLEAAKSFKDLGVTTHIINNGTKMMPRQLDDAGAALLNTKIRKLKIKTHFERHTVAIEGKEHVEALRFKDNSTLPIDIVLISTGIYPRDELAKESGIETGERGGIIINDHLQTNDPNVYAIGDCALHDGIMYGLIAPGYKMAQVLAERLTGKDSTFQAMDSSTRLKLFGVDVSSIGDPLKKSPRYKEVSIMNESTGIYKKIVTDKITNTLIGAILVGDNSDYNKLYQYYIEKTPLPPVAESLLIQTGDTDNSFDLKGQICSCANVSYGDVAKAIEDGAGDANEIKKITGAGSGCGSCMSLVKQFHSDYIEKAGGSIDKSVCEHFSYSRIELAQIIRTTGARSFHDIITSHGNGGSGCELCKPAIASILASYTNDHILLEDLAALQETNDRYLGNIQKNGTYSVVPRVPGGEILPEQLIAIGQVAQEFKLYTKITGGQRVDLFGARLEDLPIIWEKLIAVGLESGHAYAKSLRTVKSCVGSTWCRYGVQDSVKMAIDLENRYKGIRTPHKVKMAVSGCARECAEAQSKDVGVIATESGWNLYLCGNGGMKPAHAVLFATDIDDATLVQYIDRFMMYYIRTADKLTRTASWFENLPGGLEHLQDVIMKDSLKICTDLDREMAYLVDTFQCEWTTAVTTPEIRKTFRSFINSNAKDETIQFVEVRGQIKPILEKEELISEATSTPEPIYT
ncbi:MAG: nitrite reductase large subunit NirB [Fibrobacterales bacterium]